MVVADRVGALRAPRPVCVAVDGPDAAGKTTFAGVLGDALRERGRVVVPLAVDDHPRPEEVRHARGRDSPEGYYRDAVDQDALIAAVGAPTEPGTIVLCEGIFLLRPELLGMWDLTIHVTAPFETRLLRALARHVPQLGTPTEVEHLYRTRYEPGQDLYRAAGHPAQAADILIDTSNPDHPTFLSRT